MMRAAQVRNLLPHHATFARLTGLRRAWSEALRRRGTQSSRRILGLAVAVTHLLGSIELDEIAAILILTAGAESFHTRALVDA